MAVNNQKKIAFIHIPKTAGRSIIKSLNLENDGHFRWHYYTTHFRKYFMFSVVRNPYNRFISACFHIKTLTEKQRLNHPDFNILSNNSIEEILKGIKDGKISLKHITFYDQSGFIFNHQNNLMINRVIRYERLESGISKLCKDFNIPNEPIPHIGLSDRKGWREYLNTKWKRDVVYNMYKRDFKKIAYER